MEKRQRFGNKEGSENRRPQPLTFPVNINMEFEEKGGKKALLYHILLFQWKIPYFEFPSAILFCPLWPIKDFFFFKKRARVREKQLCCREEKKEKQPNLNKKRN